MTILSGTQILLGFDVPVEVCGPKVPNISSGWFSHDRND